MDDEQTVLSQIEPTRKQKVSVKLAYFKNKEFTISDIERFLDLNNPQPDLREFLKKLITLGIFVESKKTNNGYMLYRIDYKLYKKLLNRSELVLLVDEFNKITKQDLKYLP